MGVRLFLIAAACLTACTQSGPAPVLRGVIQDGTAVIPIYEAPVLPTPVFEPPEGYPYPLGDLSGSIGSSSYVLKSYDYSVGAIDPAVWTMEIDGVWRMRATFENATDPKAFGPEVTFKANPPAALAMGMRFPATIELVKADGKDNPVVLRTVVPAEVAITGFVEGGSGTYDRISGTVTGPICTPGGIACAQMALRFETGVYQNDW